MLEDIAIGVTAELIAAGVCFSLATAILLPGVARLVVAIAVELDRQSLLRPAAVHPSPAGGTIRLRQHEAGLSQELQEALLQLAQGYANLASHHPP